MKEVVMKVEFLNKDIVKCVKSYESLDLLQQNDPKQIIYPHSRGKRWTYPWLAWMLANNKNPKSWSTLLALREIVSRSFEGQAILLDNVLDGLSKEDKEKAFDILKTCKAQIIMTAKCEDEIIEGANVIRLNTGGRKNEQ